MLFKNVGDSVLIKRMCFVCNEHSLLLTFHKIYINKFLKWKPTPHEMCIHKTLKLVRISKV